MLCAQAFLDTHRTSLHKTLSDKCEVPYIFNGLIQAIIVNVCLSDRRDLYIARRLMSNLLVAIFGTLLFFSLLKSKVILLFLIVMI